MDEKREPRLSERYDGVLNEKTGKYLLNVWIYDRITEPGCVRIKRLTEQGFACLSAWREGRGNEANVEAHRALTESLKDHETRFLSLLDVWQEERGPAETLIPAQFVLIPFRPEVMDGAAFEARIARLARDFEIPSWLFSPPGEGGALYRMEWSEGENACLRAETFPGLNFDTPETLFASLRRGRGQEMAGRKFRLGGYIYPSGHLHAMGLANSKWEYVLWSNTGINADHAPREQEHD